MKIGILACGHINQLLNQQFDDYPIMLTSLLTKYIPDVDVIIYDLTQDDFPNDIDECHAYISSGSAVSVLDDEAWIHRFEDLVRLMYARHKKFVGICFGHQMIAKAFGGEVVVSRKGWSVGARKTQVIHEKPWMKPPVSEYTLLQSHAEQVLEIPTGAQLIASNDFCPNAMFQMGDSLLAIQSHPEYCPDYMRALMDIRQSSIGKQTVYAAEGTLNESLDVSLIVQWIINFIQSD